MSKTIAVMTLIVYTAVLYGQKSKLSLNDNNIILINHTEKS